MGPCRDRRWQSRGPGHPQAQRPQRAGSQLLSAGGLWAGRAWHRPSRARPGLPGWPRSSSAAVAGRAGRLLDELASPAGLTAQASTFARRDVLDALAKRLPVAASADQALGILEDLADEFLGSRRAVLVTVDRGLDEPRYSLRSSSI
jgi:hypothetical protein